MEAKYQRIRKIVTKELSHSHHDIEHVERVYNLHQATVRLSSTPAVDATLLCQI
jgi:hypothetical protein